MRHFMTLTAITLALATNLAACRDTSSKNPESLSPAEIADQTQPATDPADSDSRGFTANGRFRQSFKNSYPLEYACTTELCTPEFQKYPSRIETTQAASLPTDAQKKYYADYIQPALVNYYNSRKANSAKWLSQLEAKDADFANIKLSDDQLRILQTLNALQNSDKIPLMSLYWTGKFSQVDFQKAFAIYQHMGTWSYLQQMHPKLSLIEAAKMELDFIEKNLPRLSKIIGGANSLDANITEKIKASQALDLDEMEELSEYSISIHRLEHFLFGEGKAVIAELMKMSPLTPEMLYQIYSKKKLQTEHTKRMQTDLRDNCSDRYFQSINLYPQTEQLEKFKSLAEQTRESALSLISTQDPAYEKVKAIQFMYPPTSDKNSTSWLNALLSKAASIQEDTDGLEQLDSQSLYAKALIMTMFADYSKEENLCPKIPDEKISDKNAVAYGYVMVSWYSVRYPELGASIVAHEIGHSVYAYSNMSDVTKSCLKQKQASDNFTNEDFADLFSAKVSQNLAAKYQIPTGNMACALMDNLYPLNSRDTSDPHSTFLYRALQLNIANGKQIPASCQQLALRDNAAATNQCN
ncbi:hypothetical protein [Bdellovibrio sp. KM01]|uniref:hypothetical protein n=1 Tax=Bdellovibrio sp. KM01 TaxID=2748865 RepID=UPI0015EA179B|nr:hypothetical protein [Bdellovibrio sp. KM01]QLY24482.1 hypothetical protein HW988_13590 [Bdellovibrio sp. KM01]